MKKKISAYIAIFTVVCLIAGCNREVGSADNASVESSGEDRTRTVEMTDMKGRTVNIPADVQKVVVTFNMEEYFAVAGEEGTDRLVGWSHGYWEGRRDDAYAAFTSAFPALADIPDVGYNENISIEAIISLQPDVVLASSTGANYNALEPAFENLREAGIECIFFDFHAQTVDTHCQSIRLLGAVLGKEARADEIADFYAEQMRTIAERVKKISEPDRPRVYMEFSMGPDQYGGTWSEQMWGALIRECGGYNIAAGMEGASVEISAEQVLSSNPEVIVFTCSPRKDVTNNIVLGYGADEAAARKNLDAYKERDGWVDLEAVKTGNMGAVYHDLSRHIFDFAGAQFLAKQLHPELFADIEPREALEEFFARYMPVDPDGAWMICLED